MASKTPKTLYHYCSVETFFNITRNRIIWLSDILQSNDELELAYMKNAYSDLAQKTISRFQKNRKGFSLKEYVDLNFLTNFYGDIPNINVSKTWTFCLSEEGDLLSQWRGYADDGTGISIGFNTEKLCKIIDSIQISRTTTTANGTIELKKVNYKETDMLKEVKKFINPMECAHYSDIEDLDKKLKEPLFALMLSSPFYKSSSFSEEKEWRIALNMLIEPMCNYQKIDVSSSEISLGNFSYILSRKRLISHYELKFHNLSDVINCVFLGPKCKISTIELQHYLISIGLLSDTNDSSIEILKSASSYR